MRWEGHASSRGQIKIPTLSLHKTERQGWGTQLCAVTCMRDCDHETSALLWI